MRTWLVVASLAFVLPSGRARTESFPARPVHVVVAAPAGSGIDVAIRIMADRLRDELGQPIVIEIKAGADGILAARQVAGSAPDGYTLLAASNGTMAINPTVHPNLPYDPVRDFEPVSLIAQSPSVLIVGPSLPVRSVQDFIAYAGTRPGRLNYGSGSSNYMFAMEMLKELAGIDLYHIPYTGNPAAMLALIVGDIQVAMVSLASAAGHISSGKIKALAVTGVTRSPQFPVIPTLAEAGVRGYDLDVWIAVFAPARTPAAVIDRLNAAFAQAFRDAELGSRLVAAGLVPMGSTPQSLRDIVERDARTYRALGARAGVR